MYKIAQFFEAQSNRMEKGISSVRGWIFGGRSRVKRCLPKQNGTPEGRAWPYMWCAVLAGQVS